MAAATGSIAVIALIAMDTGIVPFNYMILISRSALSRSTTMSTFDDYESNQ